MLNEFRQDLVSGEWVLFATERAKRPYRQQNKKVDASTVKKNCPFEDPKSAGNELVWFYPEEKEVESFRTFCFIKATKPK